MMLQTDGYQLSLAAVIIDISFFKQQLLMANLSIAILFDTASISAEGMILSELPHVLALILC